MWHREVTYLTQESKQNSVRLSDWLYLSVKWVIPILTGAGAGHQPTNTLSIFSRKKSVLGRFAIDLPGTTWVSIMKFDLTWRTTSTSEPWDMSIQHSAFCCRSPKRKLLLLLLLRLFLIRMICVLGLLLVCRYLIMILLRILFCIWHLRLENLLILWLCQSESERVRVTSVHLEVEFKFASGPFARCYRCWNWLLWPVAKSCSESAWTSSGFNHMDIIELWVGLQWLRRAFLGIVPLGCYFEGHVFSQGEVTYCTLHCTATRLLTDLI